MVDKDIRFETPACVCCRLSMGYLNLHHLRVSSTLYICVHNNNVHCLSLMCDCTRCYLLASLLILAVYTMLAFFILVIFKSIMAAGTGMTKFHKVNVLEESFVGFLKFFERRVRKTANFRLHVSFNCIEIIAFHH